jgi:hypothetical protein
MEARPIDFIGLMISLVAGVSVKDGTNTTGSRRLRGEHIPHRLQHRFGPLIALRRLSELGGLRSQAQGRPGVNTSAGTFIPSSLAGQLGRCARVAMCLEGVSGSEEIAFSIPDASVGLLLFLLLRRQGSTQGTPRLNLGCGNPAIVVFRVAVRSVGLHDSMELVSVAFERRKTFFSHFILRLISLK